MKKRKTKEEQSLVKIIIGVIFLIAGFIGILFPVIPGFLLILTGLAFLNNKNIKTYIVELIKQTKKITKLAVFSMFAISLILLSPNLTGNAITDIEKSTSNLLACIFFILALILAHFYFISKKQENQQLKNQRI